MSIGRCGYNDDDDDDDDHNRYGVWRGVIASATRGKRGQAFFRALVAALDAMPHKALVKGELEDQEGAVCALGCLGKAHGLDLSHVDTEDYAFLGQMFDIAPQLAQEVMFINDHQYRLDGPESRWRIVRDWAARQISLTPEEVAGCTIATTGHDCSGA